MRFAANRDYLLAADCFQQLCDIPHGGTAGDWLLLSTCLMHLGRGSDAVAALSKGRRRFPADADIARRLADAELYSWANSHDANKSGNLAVGDEKALQLRRVTRVTGLIDHPPGAVIKTLQVRVIDAQGATRATQTVRL